MGKNWDPKAPLDYMGQPDWSHWVDEIDITIHEAEIWLDNNNNKISTHVLEEVQPIETRWNEQMKRIDSRE